MPELSVRWARTALGAPQFEIGRVNVTPRTADLSSPLLEISPRALDRVLELNQQDFAIYTHALARFFAILPSLAQTEAQAPDLLPAYRSRAA